MSLLAYFHFAYLGSRKFFCIMKKGEEMESMPEDQQNFLHTLHRFMSKKGSTLIRLPQTFRDIANAR